MGEGETDETDGPLRPDLARMPYRFTVNKQLSTNTSLAHRDFLKG
jgi:hypothetical protein